MAGSDYDPAPEQGTQRGGHIMGAVATTAMCRLLLNTARRFAYPFAPVLSRGLGVSLPAITGMIAVSQATSLLGVVLGPLTDRWGYRRMMLLGLGLLAAGMIAAGAMPTYAVVLLAFFLAGLGKTIFDPALQGYVGERVPYRQRGLVIGLVEFSWAGSTLIGVPLIAVLINSHGWRSPFWVLGALAIIGMLAILAVIAPQRQPSGAVTSRLGIRSAWAHLRQERSALGMLVFAFFLSVANDNLFVVYGAWLEKTFALSIVALGLGTAVIGAAEFCGESLTALIGDRFGLKKVLFVAVILTTLGYGILPFTGGTLGFALAGLFVLFLTFELMVVTSISVSTELLPRARATMMSGYYAAAGIGRVTGALIGVPIWQQGGIVATCAVSVVLSAMALLALWWGLRHWRR